MFNKFNEILNFYSSNDAILNCRNLEWTQTLRNNYEIIYSEYKNFHNNIYYHYEQVGYVAKTIDKYKKWKSIIIYAFGRKTEYSKFFPKTMELLKDVPCRLVMFSILEPGAYLSPHKGVYSGVLRYHLALKTPQNYQKCHINILQKNGKVYTHHWRTGQDILFDDMYTHWVKNETNEERVVLFLDIEKKFHNLLFNVINKVILYLIKYYNSELSNYITNIDCNYMKNIIFPYFIEDVVPNSIEIMNFKLNVPFPQNNKFWLQYYTFLHRENTLSMASKSDIELIETLVNKIYKKKGDIVEIGCWRGGMSLYLKYLFRKTNKKLFMFDTFQNFPISSNETNMNNIEVLYKNSFFSKEKIRKIFKKYDLDKNVFICEGTLDKTLFGYQIDRISLLKVDCDSYDSILLTLTVLYEKIEKNGIILINDYNLVNCKEAVDDFRKKKKYQTKNTFSEKWKSYLLD